MDKLYIRLLGPIELKRGTRSLLGFESNKVRALISYLVVESGRPHQRRRLAALLWPEVPESTALSSLRYALSNLRKVIGDRSAQPPFLIITPQTIQFNTHSNSWVDVALFEQYCTHAQENPLDFSSLRKAAELYRGRFLEGFSIPDSIAFEEWIVVKRERLDRLAYQVLHQMANDFELIGDYERAIAYAQRQIELDPWREEVHQQIMRCLYYSGQRSAAIAQYEACCQSLAAGLGLEPSPDTLQLIREIREETLSPPPTPPAFFHPSASTTSERSPFVSREEPLNRLHTTLDTALGGQGQLLLITGNPGQGKTALVQEFIQQALEAHPALGAAWGNSAAYFGSGDPFLPFREILEMLTGQVEHRWEAGSISHQHARRLWRLTPTSVQALVQAGPSLIGTFISGYSLLGRASIISQNEPTWLNELQMIVDQHSERQPESIKDFYQQYCRVLIEVSHRVPLLLFVDDLQWADQASLGLFFHLSRHLAGARILLLGAFRPPEDPPGDDDSPSLADMVNELRLRHSDILIDLDLYTERQFIDALLDQEPNQLDEGFREALFRYTNSHPLYTTEMLYDMKARGYLVKNKAGKWVAADCLDWDYIPPRIEAAIQERLRRLPKDLLDLLKIASVEGERFTAEAIAQVQKSDEEHVVEQLRENLDHQHKLVQADSSRHLAGKRLSRYRFRHILFQRYLYSHLDAVECADLHEQVASALEDHYTSILEEVSVPLAIHFELAGLPLKAILYFEMAGQRANRFSSYEDAIAHYKKALALLGGQPETEKRNQQELDLLMRLSVPLMFVRGFASQNLRIECDRIMELIKNIPLNVEMFPIMHTLTQYYGLRAEYQKTLDVLKQADQLARMSEDQLFTCLANWGYGFLLLWLGEFKESLLRLETMVDYYNPHEHRELRLKYGNDAGIASRIWSSWTLWFLGYPEKALARCKKAIDLANALDDPANQLLAQIMTAYLSLLMKNFQGINELLQSCSTLLAKHPGPIYEANLEFLQGFYLYQKTEKKAGLIGMLKGVDMYQAIGNRSMLSQYFTLLAEAYFENNQFDQAALSIQQAENFIEVTNERFYQAEVLRVKGKLLKKANKLHEAETCFWHALKVARGQKAKTLELRAAISLARLWQGQDQTGKAYQVLAEVYSWFTEGFQTTDLQEAKSLLESLF